MRVDGPTASRPWTEGVSVSSNVPSGGADRQATLGTRPGRPRRSPPSLSEGTFDGSLPGSADPARSRQTEGAGLGLTLAKWIANHHNGPIDVESREGEGSTFTVRIPLAV